MTDESSKKAILARRRRFVAAAIATVGIAGCGSSESTSTPEPCLSPVLDSSTDTADAGDTNPSVCLSAPFDTGPETTDASVDATDATDTPGDADAGGD